MWQARVALLPTGVLISSTALVGWGLHRTRCWDCEFTSMCSRPGRLLRRGWGEAGGRGGYQGRAYDSMRRLPWHRTRGTFAVPLTRAHGNDEHSYASFFPPACVPPADWLRPGVSRAGFTFSLDMFVPTKGNRGRGKEAAWWKGTREQNGERERHPPTKSQFPLPNPTLAIFSWSNLPFTRLVPPLLSQYPLPPRMCVSACSPPPAGEDLPAFPVEHRGVALLASLVGGIRDARGRRA